MQREGKYITDFLSKVSFATFIIGSRRRIRRKKSYLLIGCVRESITLFYRMPQSNFNLLNVVINCKLEQKRGGKRTITSKLNGAEQILWRKRWRWRRARNRLSLARKLRSLTIITHGRERNPLFNRRDFEVDLFFKHFPTRSCGQTVRLAYNTNFSVSSFELLWSIVSDE